MGKNRDLNLGHVTPLLSLDASPSSLMIVLMYATRYAAVESLLLHLPQPLLPPPFFLERRAGGQELIKNPISRWIVYFKSGNDFHRTNKLKSTRGNRLVVLVGTTLRDGEEESFVRDQTAE